MQRDVPLQAIVIDAGHQRAFFGYRCLFLDDRRHDYRLLHIFVQADGSRDFAKLFYHRRQHVVHALGAREFIRGRKQISFERLGFWSQIGNQRSISVSELKEFLFRSQARILHRLRDIKDGISLWNDQCVHVNVAAGHPIMNIYRGGGTIE